ncbi:TonB-dependent receptor [Gilvimarinus agarilyticus]|uniref:TonB-dependent receptor n=1 Tax=Gilvimarinus agarilyticus TaxID=679259 RepID=UPI0005A25DEF|nr:TonB-dependent receptor [Gilvimarinus agarilyticus]
MHIGKEKFKRKLLVSSIASCLFASSYALAQDGEDAMIEEVVVTGVYASQQNAVNTKRDAAAVVDAISAEDIGKLPDVTISDSLQRIPGIQVERTAGEGGPVQIRGMAGVATSLNGETFLSATSIDTSSADFGDLPSQLFSGADVYKAPFASLASVGTAGTVNLKTRRPFDLDDGWTFSGSAEVDHGSISDEYDPTISGLIGYNADKWGVLVSAVTTEKNLATDFNGWFDTSENGGIGAARANGGADPDMPGTYYVVPQGFSAYNKQEERQRDGVNVSFQAELSDGIELVADYFYSDQERYNRRAGFSSNNRWQTFSNYAFPLDNETGGESWTYQPTAPGSAAQPWVSLESYEARPLRIQSFSQTNYNLEHSENASVELNFDDGGPLTGQVRVTTASAEHQMRHGYGEGDVIDVVAANLNDGKGGFVPAEYCSDANDIVGDKGGCYVDYQADSVQEADLFDTDWMMTYEQSGDDIQFGGFDSIVNGGQGQMSVADYMASIDSYHVGAFSSENNTDTEGTLDTFSTRWNYAFDETPFISSVDVGVRQSRRTVDRSVFSLFGGLDSTGDCYAQWRAVDQAAEFPDVCNKPDDELGEMVGGEWVPYQLLPPTRVDEFTNAVWIDSYSDNVNGVPGVWAIDPREFDDAAGFMDRVFGDNRRLDNAGQSYGVKLDELSYFAQVNFEAGPVSGNVGVNVIETDLAIRQNLVGPNYPHSGTGPDIGDVITERSYTDVLPSANVNYTVTDDLVLRLGYGETMMPVDMLQWGGGKTVGQTFNTDCACMRIENVSFAGNPDLDPTRSSTLNLSAEWYLGAASMVSATYFELDIDSFVVNGTIQVLEPDADGVNRGPNNGYWTAAALVQGTGGSVEGVELQAKMAFSDITDGFMSNFGFDVNYTLSESSQDAIGFNGEELPFPNNSEDTYNLVGWFENDFLSARLAYNFRSPRLITGGNDNTGGQGLYQDEYGQLDMNVTWDVTDNVAVYVNGSNITEEIQQTYMEFEEQEAFQNVYEARWALGARVNF